LETLPGVEGWKEAALKKAITTKDGLEAFKRALNSDLTQVIVSPESLNHLLEQSQAPFDPTMYLSRIQNGTKVPPQESSQRDGQNQPTKEVEAVLAEIWNSVFGFEQIGIHDNFSQVGGHSLLAMQIVAQIRSSYQIHFTLREFFAAPTIAQLSSVVQARISGESESLTDDQARPLLSPMGQRFFCASRLQKVFFFGPSNQQVFASYHPPVGGSGQVLTVICPPLFNEYMLTQLALRELAISLAERGQHVLRFDYRGTGDSFGELGEVAISDWVEDIALAVREGRELSGSSVVRLLGVRAGALLACRSAGASSDVQRLVLWDPVPDGAGYLQVLRGIQVAMLEQNLYLSRAERREAMHEYAGHRLSERMLEEFRLLDASAYSSVPKSKLHVVSTSPEVSFPVSGVPQDVAQFTCNWETDLANLMMPKPVLERLSACLTVS
jgi:pimeloyl-ACP methyl ester carboxylesterase/acyl carrier protein